MKMILLENMTRDTKHWVRNEIGYYEGICSNNDEKSFIITNKYIMKVKD